MNSIVQLFTDTVADEPGKRILVKIDSGPRRRNVDMSARLKNLGFYLYPGVPNTTSISQETDQNYGMFKSAFRFNLGKVVEDSNELGMNTTVSITLIGLIIFGGTNPITKRVCYRNDFQEAFSKEKCLEAWAKVGAAPLTMKCLESEKVRNELTEDNDDDNPLAEFYRAMQAHNDLSVAWLNANGLSGKHMVAKVDRKKE